MSKQHLIEFGIKAKVALTSENFEEENESLETDQEIIVPLRAIVLDIEGQWHEYDYIHADTYRKQLGFADNNISGSTTLFFSNVDIRGGFEFI